MARPLPRPAQAGRLPVAMWTCRELNPSPCAYKALAPTWQALTGAAVGARDGVTRIGGSVHNFLLTRDRAGWFTRQGPDATTRPAPGKGRLQTGWPASPRH